MSRTDRHTPSKYAYTDEQRGHGKPGRRHIVWGWWKNARRYPWRDDSTTRTRAKRERTALRNEQSAALGPLTTVKPVLDQIAETCTPEWAAKIDAIITANCADKGHYYANADRCTACGTRRTETTT